MLLQHKKNQQRICTEERVLYVTSRQKESTVHTSACRYIPHVWHAEIQITVPCVRATMLISSWPLKGTPTINLNFSYRWYQNILLLQEMTHSL